MRLVLCALAVSAAAFASTIGGSSEVNPVRTHPHAEAQSGIHRVIVRLRSLAGAPNGSSKLETQGALDRIAGLALRAGVTVRTTKAITADIQAIQVLPA